MTDLITQLPPQSVIVLDNASFHKGKDMIQALEKEGHHETYTFLCHFLIHIRYDKLYHELLPLKTPFFEP